MNFEQALNNLRSGEILKRKALVGKMIKLKNNQFVLWDNNSFDRPIYTFTNEDIMAEDWEVVNPDDIKEFSLSANELKDLGVSQEAIDELKKTMPKRLIDIKGSEVKMDKDKLESLLSKNVQNPIIANVKLPDFSPLLKK